MHDALLNTDASMPVVGGSVGQYVSENKLKTMEIILASQLIKIKEHTWGL